VSVALASSHIVLFFAFHNWDIYCILFLNDPGGVDAKLSLTNWRHAVGGRGPWHCARFPSLLCIGRFSPTPELDSFASLTLLVFLPLTVRCFCCLFGFSPDMLIFAERDSRLRCFVGVPVETSSVLSGLSPGPAPGGGLCQKHDMSALDCDLCGRLMQSA
jgi:hypothetical protein